MVRDQRRYMASRAVKPAALLRGVLIGLVCMMSAPAWAGAPAPAITFVPAQPSSRDTIDAYLSESDCGQTTTFVVSGSQITISTSPPTGCGTPPPVTLAPLGTLPAGTYQVQWYESGVLAATAPLVVTGAVDATPLLQPWGTLLLAAGCAMLAFARRRRRA